MKYLRRFNEEKESRYKLMDFINPLRLSKKEKSDVERIKKLLKHSKAVGTSRFFDSEFLTIEIDIENGVYARLKIDRHWTDITGRDLYHGDINLLGHKYDQMEVEYYENVPNYYKGKKEKGMAAGKSRLKRSLMQDYFKLDRKFRTKWEEVSLTPSLLRLYYSKYKEAQSIKGI